MYAEKRLFRAFCFAIAVHLLGYLLFSGLIRRAVPVLRSRVSLPDAAVPVQIGTGEDRVRGAPAPFRGKKGGFLSLRDLGVPLFTRGERGEMHDGAAVGAVGAGARDSVERSRGALSASMGSGVGSDSGAGVEIVQESRNHQLYRFLYQQIDDNLVYPAELKDAGISGEVRATVRFSGAGELVQNQLQLESASKYLQVLVRWILKRAFSVPLPSEKRMVLNGPFEVNCLFRFEITEHDDEMIKKEMKFIVSNRLSFYRNYHHSKLQWKAGPLGGLGPLVGMDVLWFPKKLGELLSKKAKIDSLEKYRDDPTW